jgi:hypothetical protein
LAAPGRKFHSEEALARVILGEDLKSGRLTDLLPREPEGAFSGASSWLIVAFAAYEGA